MRPGTILMLIVVAGCSSAPPAAPVEYLLRPSLEPSAGAEERTPSVALGRITVAPYLARDSIVIETAEHRIQAARGHRWAEPLSRSLRRMLQVGISRASGRPVADAQDDATAYAFLVDVDIHRFHGSLEGDVVFAAEWRLREPGTGRVLSHHEFVQSTLTTEPGYDAVVRAHVSLLEGLSSAIAESFDAQDVESSAQR